MNRCDVNIRFAWRLYQLPASSQRCYAFFLSADAGFGSIMLMREDQIPEFVEEIIATGCNITAVGRGYVVGDSDLPVHEYLKIAPVLKQIERHYGMRDHLVEEIREYLISIGRFYELPSIQ